MKTRIVVLGTVLSGLMLIAAQASASANVVWCMSDPPIQVETPGGHNLTVNNMVYLPPAARHLKLKLADDAVAYPDGRGGSFITVHVHVPSGVEHAHVVSSDMRYQVTSSGDGAGGMIVTLLLDVPTS
ncbi:MAG: hypothetical protein ACREOM_12790 [Candidatus Dormibacteraceae bacterium]